jgi:hypothetical protein
VYCQNQISWCLIVLNNVVYEIVVA